MKAYSVSLIFQIATAVGCVVHFWKVRDPSDQSSESDDRVFFFDLDWLEETIAANEKRLKMFVLNFPHNPTGAVPSVDVYRRALQLAEQHNLIVFSDEMYHHLEQPFVPEIDRLPSASDLYPRLQVYPHTL